MDYDRHEEGLQTLNPGFPDRKDFSDNSDIRTKFRKNAGSGDRDGG